MKTTLFDRMKTWVELLQKREDLEFTQTPIYRPAEEIFSGYPEDAQKFAQSTGELLFVYRNRSTDSTKQTDGTLCLTLVREQVPCYMELTDGTVVDENDLCIVDGDFHGTGNAAWYLLPKDGPARIFWSVEDMIEYSSLTDYLTQGARRGFAGGGWQRLEGADLFKFSKPRSTPIPEIREGLIERGAAPEMADDLIEWLGADVVLLLPA